MDPTAEPADARPLAPTPGGSLGLLAFGYRGVAAWRAARGTDWIAEFSARRDAATEAAGGATPDPEDTP